MERKTHITPLPITQGLITGEQYHASRVLGSLYPNSEEQTLNIKKTPLRLQREKIVKAFTPLKDKKNRSNDATTVLDKELTVNLAGMYNISEDEVSNFIIEAKKIARQVMQQINSFVETDDFSPVQFEEIKNTISPTELFAYGLFSRDNELKFEARRELLIRAIAFDILVSQKKDKIQGLNSKLQNLFTESLFLHNDETSSRRIPIRVASIHDNKTSDVKRYEVAHNGEQLNPLYLSKKEHRRDFTSMGRLMKLKDGEITRVEYTQPMKELDSAVIKAIVKAVKDETIGSNISISELVPDLMRAKIVVFDESKIDDVIEVVIEAFRNNEYREKYQYPPVVAIIPKHENGTNRQDGLDRGGSKSFKMRRYMIHFEGIQYPFEVIFQNVTESLNGVVSRNDSHELYEIKRATAAVQILTQLEGGKLGEIVEQRIKEAKGRVYNYGRFKPHIQR